MNYSIEKLPNGRWGIYVEFKLLATIGCEQTALTILALLRREKEVKTKYKYLSSLKSQRGLNSKVA